MKATMVIPTYWSRPSYTEWNHKDEVYDYPNPLDKEGTLFRILESMKILKTLISQKPNRNHKRVL